MNSEPLSEDKIIQAMTRAQFGSPEQSNAIEQHMKEYFTRWPSYKDKFTHLEWYHIFLDFHEAIDKFKSKDNIPSLSEDKLNEAKVDEYKSHAALLNSENLKLEAANAELKDQLHALTLQINEMLFEMDELEKQIATQNEFIENGLDANDRFDRAEKQWYERSEKLESRLKAANEYLERNGMPTF